MTDKQKRFLFASLFKNFEPFLGIRSDHFLVRGKFSDAGSLCDDCVADKLVPKPVLGFLGKLTD